MNYTVIGSSPEEAHKVSLMFTADTGDPISQAQGRDRRATNLQGHFLDLTNLCNHRHLKPVHSHGTE